MAAAAVLAAALASAASPQVKITPWCDNSARVVVSPPASYPSPNVDIKGSIINRALVDECSNADTGNLKLTQKSDGIVATRADTGATLFTATWKFAPSTAVPSNLSLIAVNLTITAGDPNERVYGLGQGDWNQGNPGCATPRNTQVVVPLERNGQTIALHQRKFFVAIPFVYSTAGYGFLLNMPGNGEVSIGAQGKGGATWSAVADYALDFWVTALPTGVGAPSAAPIYAQYADATGHAPPLPADWQIFVQSRNRYMTSEIALGVAKRYQELDLPVGVLVIDYKNQVHDGDFQPDPACFPSLKTLSDTVREAINATTVFSFWPEVLQPATEFPVLQKEGCLINSDLGGLAIDPTTAKCRDFIWSQFLKPRYFDQGISNYWLDESDGEGTAGGDGIHGYDTSFGPAAFASNLWVNDWLRMFTEPVAQAGKQPNVLTRGVWAGGARHGVVLWSSDIESTFEELTVQVPQGVHASMSGIPFWTTDVGGYGCGFSAPQNSSYMQELIVRWYQFGAFCPVFRTHGCRYGRSNELPPNDPCVHHVMSCGPNEIWSYGPKTQAVLEKYVRLRASPKLLPYVTEVNANASNHGQPTMRPLSYEFPNDPKAYGHNDQYLLGDRLLVAPVTVQNATSRSVYFPSGASWRSFWDDSTVVSGGTSRVVNAPLDTVPVYWRV